MDAEKVVEEIIAQASKEAERIEEQGRKEAERIIKEAEKRAEEVKKKKLEEVQKLCEEMKKSELALAKLKAKKEVMERKREIIEELLEEIRKRFISLEGEKRKKVLEALAKKAGKNWAVICCNKRDMPFLKRIFKNSKFKEGKVEAGFIAQNESGDVQVNMSFTAVFESCKKELQKYLLRLGERR